MIYGNKFLNNFTNNSDDLLLEGNYADTKNKNGIRLYNRNDVYIDINPDEGPIPHFHICIGDRKKKDPKDYIEGSISLIHPEYRNDPWMNLELNNKDIRTLIAWLSKVPNGETKNNWRLLANGWNNGPARVKPNMMFVPNTYEMPDYSVIYPRGTFNK